MKLIQMRFISVVLSVQILSTCTPQISPTSSPTATEVPVPTETPTPMHSSRFQNPGDYIDSLLIGGVERWFMVHIPPGYRPGVPLPLVINLHGRGSSAASHQATSRMVAKADEEGFIVVAPQALGSPATWWGVFLGPEGDNDMDFFKSLLEYLKREISIDHRRVFVAGISNGATMANRLGCALSEQIAAIAPVAGAHSGFPYCEINSPVSVIALHGTEDIVIPFEGNDSDVPSVHMWVEAWANRDGCEAEPKTNQPYDDVILERWGECEAKTEVVLYSVVGGGHAWLLLGPGTYLDGYASALSATDVIWDFFETHPKLDQ